MVISELVKIYGSELLDTLDQPPALMKTLLRIV